tara:strand:- start:28 stop:177 length:150 start_codon:yes stop_codon:yes gene_type:complete
VKYEILTATESSRLETFVVEITYYDIDGNKEKKRKIISDAWNSSNSSDE